MQQRERLNPIERPANTAEAGGDAASAVATAAARIAAAAESVAERILSGNSQAFLQATEQHGGQ